MTDHGLDLAIRATGIGSSEIGAIIGVSPFNTRLGVYISKVYGEKPRKSTPSQRWGLLLEQAMHVAYEQDTGLELEGDGRTTIRHPEHEFMLDSVDRITKCRTRVVDFKTASSFTPLEYGEIDWEYRVWEKSLHATKDETELIPQCYQAQGHWHMACHDVDNFDLPLLIDGSRWRIYSMPRDREVEGMLIEEGRKFWYDHVLPRKPPEPENEDERAELLACMYPKHVRETPIASTPEMDGPALQLRAARKERIKWEGEETHWKNECKEIIGDAAGLAGDWGRIDWVTNTKGVRVFTPRFRKEE